MSVATVTGEANNMLYILSSQLSVAIATESTQPLAVAFLTHLVAI